MNIYLIGYRCTGKTTAGRLLAKKLGWNFFDTDEQVVQGENRSIARIVKEDGWKGFRLLENRVMETASRREDTIVSTGGGAVLNPANVQLIRRTGKTVWLKASEAVIYSRMFSDPSTAGKRPPLTESELKEEIAKTLKMRSPYYQKACDLEIETEDLTPEAIVTRILGNLS